MGCSTLGPWAELKSDSYRDGARRFETVIPEHWKRSNFTRYFLMTKDGIVLDRIMVERQKVNTKLEYTKKEFKKDMLIQDLADVEIDNFKSDQETGKFDLIDNKPASIGGQNGFLLEYTYIVVQGGLKIHGIHYGFLTEDWVYRIRYEAADQHYFKKCLDDFNQFVKSFQLI